MQYACVYMQPKFCPWRWAILAAIISIVTPIQCAFATDGHQLIGIGPIQKGLGGAGVASGKDATWLLLNPAAIHDIDRRIDVGLELFAPDRGITPRGFLLPNVPAGKMTDDSIFMIPFMGYVHPKDEWTWGVGIYGVNGMGVDYGKSRTTLPRILGQNFDRTTEYGVAKVVVAAAKPIGNGWAIGGAVNLVYSRFKTDMMTLQFRQTKGENEWDHTFGAGFSVGVHKHFERFRFGMAYTSRQWMTNFDDYSDLVPDSLDLPQTFQAGVSFDITDTLEASLDYKWLDWSGIDQIGRDPILGGFGWEDQHVIKFGLEWEMNDRWTLRGGYSHGNSPIKESYVFANALFPAVVEDHLSLGASWRMNDASEVHLTVMHAFRNTLKEDGGGDLFSVIGRGTEIYLEETTVTLGYTHRF